MQIAFTAPMKPVDDPIPSGDRTMGRLIVQALELGGHKVGIASRFRAWQKSPSAPGFADLKAAALAEADRIGDRWQASRYKPDLFLTYHLYHKAPDWIGPALADRFRIPYAVIEASRAPKRQTGDWAPGFAAADAALARADQVAALHRADAQCLAAVLPPRRLQVLLPFLDLVPFAPAASLQRGAEHRPVRLLSVAMMREGDKARSYEVLAEALAHVLDLPWELTIVGDGPARAHVEALFPPERVRFLGALPPEDLPDVYATHDLFVWPAIREAFGFVFLEAQASGLGVVAGNSFGVPDIVRDGETGHLAPEGDALALALKLRAALTDPASITAMGQAAAAHMRDHHSLEAGATRLTAFLEAAQDQFWERLPTIRPYRAELP